VSWGKWTPTTAGTVVCYLDNTVRFPHPSPPTRFAKRKERRLKRLYDRARKMSGSSPRRIRRRRRTATRRAERRLSGADPERAGPTGTSRAVRRVRPGTLDAHQSPHYTDRNVVFALFEPIKRELVLSDQQLGWLGSAYVIVLSLAALPLGVLGDLKSGARWIAFASGCGARSRRWARR